MNKFYCGLLTFLFWACNSDLQYLGETKESIPTDGMLLRIGPPEKREHKDFHTRTIPIEAINVSGDTIYFANLFTFTKESPSFGSIDFIIFDENEKAYPMRSDSIFIDDWGREGREQQYIMLPPKMSYHDEIIVSFEDYYGLRDEQIYTITAEYTNFDIQPLDFTNQLSAGKKLWTGVLKSNTYKFKL